MLVELRDFTPIDQAATRDLIQAGLSERWRDQFDPAANPDTDDLWASYVADGGEIVVATINWRIVGTGTLIALSSRCGRLIRMSTDAAFRRRGVARLIVEELTTRAAGRGFEQVVVTTDTPWKSAVSFYASCGFEIERQDELATDFVVHLAT